jgi:hypothetical protein
MNPRPSYAGNQQHYDECQLRRSLQLLGASGRITKSALTEILEV